MGGLGTSQGGWEPRLEVWAGGGQRVGEPCRALHHVRAFGLAANNYRKHGDESSLPVDFGVGEKLRKVCIDTGSADRRPPPWTVGRVRKDKWTWVS